MEKTEQALIEEAAHWHTALVLVMRQLGIVEMLILPQTINELQDHSSDPLCASVDQREEGIRVRVGTRMEGREYFEDLERSRKIREEGNALRLRADQEECVGCGGHLVVACKDVPYLERFAPGYEPVWGLRCETCGFNPETRRRFRRNTLSGNRRERTE